MRLLYIFLSLFFALNTFANDDKLPTDTHITGHILNKNNGEHVPYMTIAITGTPIGTVTDETGLYFLTIQPFVKHTYALKGVV